MILQKHAGIFNSLKVPRWCKKPPLSLLKQIERGNGCELDDTGFRSEGLLQITDGPASAVNSSVWHPTRGAFITADEHPKGRFSFPSCRLSKSMFVLFCGVERDHVDMQEFFWHRREFIKEWNTKRNCQRRNLAWFQSRPRLVWCYAESYLFPEQRR